MGDDVSVSRLLELLKAGDPDAAGPLWLAFFDRLVGAARAYLRSRHQPHDEESVAVSALESFLLRARDGRFPDLHHREELWGLLKVLMFRKAIRRWHRMKRRPEVRLTDLGPLDDARIEAIFEEESAPTLFLEAWAEAMEGLKERPRTVARLRLEGYRINEIASQLGVAEVTVHRDLRAIRQQWLRADDD